MESRLIISMDKRKGNQIINLSLANQIPCACCFLSIHGNEAQYSITAKGIIIPPVKGLRYLNRN
jgi:hypothetical protein